MSSSQFHYQTKAKENICTGSDRPQNSRLHQKIHCLKINWPFFLIKYNFITSVFHGTTTALHTKFSNKEINCWKAQRTQQMIDIDRTEHCYCTWSCLYIFNAQFSLSLKMDSSIVADITQLSDIPKSKCFLFLLEIFIQKHTCPVGLYIMSIQPQHCTN